ncbi:MAG TPA: A/G-specific adenine glycosylase [Dermatophilaceae bacterium]|nr:A/G-specific adenine glycosylase [Dermatophilaceae bacterium]
MGHPLHEPVLRWYAACARDLPWRAPGATPWGIVVSEVMLQQTPVARVLPAWYEWLSRWPSPAALAAASPGDAVRAWGRLGYPRRALRLHQAAVAMTTRYAGQVPDTVDALRALPGVGGYTAAAVASFGFGVRTAVVDTNVRRVHARAVTGVGRAEPSLTRAEHALAERLLPEAPDVARRWNVAVMELGALVCTARAPRCAACPVADRCAWARAGHPAYQGPARRAQKFEGTDRQVRGALLQVLRTAEDAVTDAELTAASPTDPARRRRCLAGLVADGLVEPLPAGRYRLPAR